MIKNNKLVLLITAGIFTLTQPLNAMNDFGDEDDEYESVSAAAQDVEKNLQQKREEVAKFKKLFLTKTLNGLTEAKNLLEKKEVSLEVVNAVCYRLAISYGLFDGERYCSSEGIQLLLNHGANSNGAYEDSCSLIDTIYCKNNKLSMVHNNNLLHAILFFYADVENLYSDFGFHLEYLTPVIQALVAKGLRVDHVNKYGYSVLDYAAGIGTFFYLEKKFKNVTVPIKYKRYLKIKEILMQTLNQTQLKYNNIQESLSELVGMPSDLIKIIQEYCDLADRKDECNYILKYQLPGEEAFIAPRKKCGIM